MIEHWAKKAVRLPWAGATGPGQDGGRTARPSKAGRAGVPAVLLLVAVVAVSVTACSSGAEIATTTTTVAASGQAGPSGRPAGGMPLMMSGRTTTTVATVDTPVGGTTTTTAPGSTSTGGTTTSTLPEGSYSDGIYLVGTDIASGLYQGTVDGSAGHWEITSDANGERFVADGDPVGRFYVKVTSGTYLRLAGVTVTKASTTASDPLLSSGTGDGTYRVGYDIAAGWYEGAVNGSLGYWEITSDANGQTLVASDYVTGPFTLKVKSGQYLTLRGVTITQ